MCIICTGEIYEENFKCLQVLDISHCKIITSEKLQEILIQCKNLRELQCIYCSSLTSLDLRNNINLETLYCYHCPSLTSLNLQENKNLRELQCYSCTSLTSLDLRNNINLKELVCSSCTSLTSLDLRNNINLKELVCSSCPSLTSLDLRSNINLEILWCFKCTSLNYLKVPSNCTYISFHDTLIKEIDFSNCELIETIIVNELVISLDLINCKKLSKLVISDCRFLTNISLYKTPLTFRYSNCLWITQYKDFINNLQRLIKMQRWYRKLLIIKYMKSQKFIEWIYSPDNIGGRLYKKWLLKNLK